MPTAPSFNTFYTSNARVGYYDSERIEGKSGYLYYKPSDTVNEQKMKKMWYENLKMTLLVGGVVLALLIVIITILVVEFGGGGSDSDNTIEQVVNESSDLTSD